MWWDGGLAVWWAVVVGCGGLWWAGCVALCYDGFSENPKLSNVELG